MSLNKQRTSKQRLRPSMRSIEEAQALRAQFGLGQPAYVQYGKWIWQIIPRGMSR